MSVATKRPNTFLILLIVATSLDFSVGWCQTSPNTSKLTLQGPPEQTGALSIRDALNRPCLDIEAIARAHVINPDEFDHVVSIKNNCLRVIKVKVCYYSSEKCSSFDVQSYKRIDTVLGTMNKIKTFRYSVTQK